MEGIKHKTIESKTIRNNAKKSKFETEAKPRMEENEKKERPEWEKRVDLWVEEKIQKEVAKIKNEIEKNPENISNRIWEKECKKMEQIRKYQDQPDLLEKDKKKSKEIIIKEIRRTKEKNHFVRFEAENITRNKFKKVFSRVFRDFAVHGRWVSNKEGERILKPFTDLDGEACLKLIQLAGWDIKQNVNKQDKDEWVENKVNQQLRQLKKKFPDLNENETKIRLRKKFNKTAFVDFVDFKERPEKTALLDVGQYNGITFLQKTNEELQNLELTNKEGLEQRSKDKNFFFNLGLIVDHHPEGAPSAAGMLFKFLNKLGMFGDNERIKSGDQIKIRKMMEFLDIVDSQGYQIIGKPENWNKTDKTILGLHRFLNFQTLWKFFQETDGDYNRELTESELKHYGLIYKKGKGEKERIVNKSAEQRKIINESNEKLKEFEKEGFIIDTDQYGRMVIDITVDNINDKGEYRGQKGKIPGGATATRSIGAGYLKWDSKQKTFFMFSDKELDENLFDQGIRVRKHLWLLNPENKKKNLTLKEVIEKIDGKVKENSELKEYIDYETLAE